MNPDLLDMISLLRHCKSQDEAVLLLRAIGENLRPGAGFSVVWQQASSRKVYLHTTGIAACYDGDDFWAMWSYLEQRISECERAYEHLLPTDPGSHPRVPDPP